MAAPWKEGRRQTVPFREPLSEDNLRLAMACLVRSSKMMSYLSDKLSVEDFAEKHAGYALIWSIVLDYLDEFKQTPKIAVIVSEMVTRVKSDPDLLTKKQYLALVSFLKEAASFPRKELDEDWARARVQQYLVDRQCEYYRDQLSVRKGSLVNLDDFISQAQIKASQIDSISQTYVFEDAMPETPVEEKPEVLIPTGVACMDYYLDGGVAAEEVVTYMGPYGSAKTLGSVMLASNISMYNYATWSAAGQAGSLGLVFYLSYEEPLKELRRRLAAYSASIPITRLRTKKFGELSTADRLEDYERSLFGSQLQTGARVFGEQERYQMHSARINSTVVLMDMRGTDLRNPKAGTGLWKEIGSVVEQGLRAYESKNGFPVHCSAVIVDYVNLAVERHMEHFSIPDDRRRHLIGKFAYHMKTYVTRPYQCSAILVNQLSAQANKKARGVVSSHTEAAEAGNFGENANFCFQISAPMLETSMATFRCSKARRAGQLPDRVVKIDGVFGKIVDVSKQWTVESRTNRIVRRDEMEEMVHGNGRPSSPRSRGGSTAITTVAGGRRFSLDD